MRHALRRLLAVVSAVVTTTAMLGTVTASALDSSICPRDESTRLVTANDGAYKVWVYQPAGETWVCFNSGRVVDGVFIFRSGLGGSLLPELLGQPANGCDVFFDLQDPAAAATIALDWHTSSPYFLCIGVGSPIANVPLMTIDLSVDPHPELWLDANTTARYYHCMYVEKNCVEYWTPVRVL